jgi:predicted nucleotidyltransferase
MALNASVENPTVRAVLLRALHRFIQAARSVPGVQRLALIGSMTTAKDDPKDVDVLVTVSATTAIPALARLGRKLKGAAQEHNRGADIFLCSAVYEYLGRTCLYRECHQRVACAGRQCASSSYLQDDLQIITLSDKLLRSPPVELWPDPRASISVPDDIVALLHQLQGLKEKAESLFAPVDKESGAA